MDKYIKLDIDDNVINTFTTKNNNDIDNLLKELSFPQPYYLNQTHSNDIKIIDNTSNYGNTGDALITRLANKPLLIKTADCIPIIIYDKEQKVLGAIHSGWKGTMNNIVGDTVDVMIDKYKCQPQNLSAYLYPSIRKCHFEIEDDVYQQFKEKIADIEKYTNKKDIKYYIDLQQIVIDSLNKKGITNIYDSKICTYCNHNDYYSYRFNHTTERNILIAMMKEQK